MLPVKHKFCVKEPFLFEWRFLSRWSGAQNQFRINNKDPKAQPFWDLKTTLLSHNSFQYFIPCFCLYSFLDQGPQFGGLFQCSVFLFGLVFSCFKNSGIDFIDCEYPSCYCQTIRTPWECEYMWLDLLIVLEGRLSDFWSQWSERNASGLRVSSLFNMGFYLERHVWGRQVPHTLLTSGHSAVYAVAPRRRSSFGTGLVLEISSRSATG